MLEKFKTNSGYMDWSEREGEHHPLCIHLTMLGDMHLTLDEARQLAGFINMALRTIDETPEAYTGALIGQHDDR